MQTQIITNELERAQLWGALNVGDMAAPEYLKELKGMISDIRTIANELNQMTLYLEFSQMTFVRFFMELIEKVNVKLSGYNADLKQGRRMEMCCLLSKLRNDDKFWLRCGNIVNKVEKDEIQNELNDAILYLKSQLEDTRAIMREFDHNTFEQFFFNEEKKFSECGVEGRFNDWLYEHSSPTLKELRELQALEVAMMLKTNVLYFAPTPSQDEINGVRVDFLKGFLPYNFEMNEKFIISCAKWRHYFHWDGTLLIINYAKYGKYIQDHYCDLSFNQKKAIYELDMMSRLINKEMEQLGQEEDDEPEDIVNNELVEKLMPIFYNNMEEVLRFLNEIDGMKSSGVTDVVNRWVKEKRISDYGNSRKGELWEILNHAGLYAKSRQNWNRRVV